MLCLKSGSSLDCHYVELVLQDNLYEAGGASGAGGGSGGGGAGGRSSFLEVDDIAPVSRIYQGVG